MSSPSNLTFSGGPAAVRYATTRSFILLVPLLIVGALVVLLSLLATPAVAQKRTEAVIEAWAQAGEAAQWHLMECMAEKEQDQSFDERNGSFFAQLSFDRLSLLEDIERCEDTVSRTAAAGPIMFEDDYQGPSIDEVEAAIQARKAVFSRTVALNPADLQ